MPIEQQDPNKLEAVFPYPARLYVTLLDQDTPDEWFRAATTPEELVEDDETITVATYGLMQVRRLKKTVTEVR